MTSTALKHHLNEFEKTLNTLFKEEKIVMREQILATEINDLQKSIVNDMQDLEKGRLLDTADNIRCTARLISAYQKPDAWTPGRIESVAKNLEIERDIKQLIVLFILARAGNFNQVLEHAQKELYNATVGIE